MADKAILISCLKEALYEHGHIVRRDIAKFTGFESKAFSRAFGSWRAALEASGYCILYGTRAQKREPCPMCGTLPQGRLKHNRRFCSTTCSNKFRAKGKWTPPKQTRDEWREHLRIRERHLLSEAPFDSLGKDWKRLRVISEQNNCCARCKLDSWMGVSLVLEVDHKNGDNSDYRRENLEALCPNCHSLTPTWRGRNKIKHAGKLDLKKIEADVESGMSVSAALKAQGRVGKGTTHREVSKHLQESRLKALQNAMDA